MDAPRHRQRRDRLCPETAACIGAAEKLAASGWLGRDERVVMFNCAAAQKYPHVVQLDLPEIRDVGALDWDWLQSAQHSSETT